MRWGAVVRGRVAALLVLGCVLVLSAAPAGAAEEVRHEGTAFVLPDGWVPAAEQRPAVWMAQRVLGEGRERGTAAIQVLRPMAASSGPFEALFARMAATLPELAGERPMARGQGMTVNGHRIAYDQRCCGRRNGVLLSQETVGITDGRRHYVLMLVGFNLRGDAQRAARAEFDALVRSFRPNAGDRAFAVVPPEGAGGLEGMYTHLNNTLRPNVFGGIDFVSENEVLILERGGLYSREVPPGWEGAGLEGYCAEKPSDCGSYRLLGGGVLQGPARIELRDVGARYGIVEVEEKPLARDGEDLRIGDNLYRRVPPLPRGTVFDGTWRYLFAQSGNGAFSSGSVSVERVLTLTRDGRFRRTGFSGVSSTVEGAGGTTGVTAGRQRPAEGGRYEAEGYRLVLVGDDGRRESLSLFRPDRDSDGLLIIGGANYLRREARK